MTDHPLIFSAPMVRALRAGRKTQTRRLLSPATTLLDGFPWTKMQRAQTWDWAGAWVDPGPSPAGNPGPYLKLPWRDGPEEHGGAYAGTVHRAYPKIRPGDTLWVREAWYAPARFDATPARDLPRETPILWEADAAGTAEVFRAAYDDIGRRRASFHMPRLFCRLTRPVSAIRIERLQAISEEDAIAEGVLDWVRESDAARGQPWGAVDAAGARALVTAAYGSLRAAYCHLWDTLHGPDASTTDPWVLVTEFPPVTPEATHG